MRPTSLRPPAFLALVAAGGLLLAACQQVGSGSSAPSSGDGAVELTVVQTDAGDALAGAGGMTLYILTEDTGGTSTCTEGGCATTWPALKGDGADLQKGAGVSGTFATTTWADGTRQVTHNGQPLYYYSGDDAPGDANGEGVGGVWFIAPVGGDQGGPSSSAAAGNPSATPYRAPGY